MGSKRFRDQREVSQKYKHLFQGCYFKFEGLKNDTKEGFIRFIKELGGNVSEDATHIFVPKKYFQKEKNKMRRDLYDINYIIDAVDHNDPSNLLDFRFIRTTSPSKNNSCLKSTSQHPKRGSINKRHTILNSKKAVPVQSTITNFFSAKERQERTNESGEKWWILVDIPVEKRCQSPFCTYEPGPHAEHYQPTKFLSMVEKKIIIKYLITNNAIEKAKGDSIYDTMISEGYLTHRSSQTLRNNFRRTILFELEKYKLDATLLKQFKHLKNNRV